MGMKRKLLKGAGYIAAPKLSFAMHHPRKAAMAGVATWALDHMTTHRRRRSSMGSTTAKGLGAAAIALPIGLWLGRRMFSQRQPQTAPM
jgi:hypothetical protein